MRRVVSVLCLAACGTDRPPEEQDPLARVRANAYQQWQRAPGYETRQASQGPHLGAVDIYIDENVAGALDADQLDEWPLGSLIVKDGFDGSTHRLVAIMEKRDDGWFWAEYLDDELKFSGKPDVCLNCHDAGGDFVLAFDLPGR